jgi:hypothetical protein
MTTVTSAPQTANLRIPQWQLPCDHYGADHGTVYLLQHPVVRATVPQEMPLLWRHPAAHSNGQRSCCRIHPEPTSNNPVKLSRRNYRGRRWSKWIQVDFAHTSPRGEHSQEHSGLPVRGESDVLQMCECLHDALTNSGHDLDGKFYIPDGPEAGEDARVNLHGGGVIRVQAVGVRDESTMAQLGRNGATSSTSAIQTRSSLASHDPRGKFHAPVAVIGAHASGNCPQNPLGVSDPSLAEAP